MKIALVYTNVTKVKPFASVGQESYDEAAERFVKTYRDFKPGIPHDLHIVHCGGERLKLHFVGFESHEYFGDGKDIGAFIYASKFLDCDWMVCLSAHTYFHRAGWLERLMEEAAYGDAMFGAMGSYEQSPHLRTSCFAVKPSTLRQYPHAVVRPEHANAAEVGPSSLTDWYEKLGGAWMVTWEGIYSLTQWREPPNIFRRGDQSNVLAWDRHTDIFAAASEAEKKALAEAADGKNP